MKTGRSQKLEVRKEESYVKYTKIFSQYEEYFWQQRGNEQLTVQIDAKHHQFL